MRAYVEPLKDKRQTGRLMHDLVKRHSADLKNFKYAGRKTTLDRLPLAEYFDIIRKIPYRTDPRPREIIARPSILLSAPWLGYDCKKKACLIASWARQNGVPFRFIASSNRADRKITHVFPQLFINGTWINADATYGHYRLGQIKKLTAAEILPEG